MSSELLKEANRSLERVENSNPETFGEKSRLIGAVQAWDQAIKLIEKYEEPKGLLQCIPSDMQKDLGKALAEVAHQEDYIKPKLSEKQQEIYDDLKSYYEASMADDPKYALSLALGDYGHNDNLNKNSDLLPALKKFLSEVEG